jgi:hypothetical protein
LNDKPFKKIEKYNENNTSGVFNTESEIQLSKKKTSRPVENEDIEEEVEVKKPKKKQKVVKSEESD